MLRWPVNNPSQRQAVESLQYALEKIQGPPGTGKGRGAADRDTKWVPTLWEWEDPWHRGASIDLPPLRAGHDVLRSVRSPPIMSVNDWKQTWSFGGYRYLHGDRCNGVESPRKGGGQEVPRGQYDHPPHHHGAGAPRPPRSCYLHPQRGGRGPLEWLSA